MLTKDTCSRGELENLKKYVTDCLTDLTNMVEEARLNFQALVDGITPIGYADIRDRTRCNRESGECTYWWDCKPCFGDNGIDVNIPDVGGSSSDAAKANGYARLNPIREARLQGRIDELNRVVRELQEHLAIREAEWKRCCKAAEKFSYKD